MTAAGSKREKCLATKCDRYVVRYDGMPTTPATQFCATHNAALRWQKAAWVSAATRREQRSPLIAIPNTTPSEVYDASNVAPKLWVGAKPPLDRSYPGVDVIVLCAAEYQPKAFPHYDKQILHCPLPDDALSSMERIRAITTGQAVAKALRTDQRVLVTCAMGINRSAFVAAIGIIYASNGPRTKLTVDNIVALMRARRHKDCLYNRHFREYLADMIGAAKKLER